MARLRSDQVKRMHKCSYTAGTWQVVRFLRPKKNECGLILFLGVDLAKNVFALHGVNETGKPELPRPGHITKAGDACLRPKREP